MNRTEKLQLICTRCTLTKFLGMQKDITVSLAVLCITFSFFLRMWIIAAIPRYLWFTWRSEDSLLCRQRDKQEEKCAPLVLH